MVVMSRLGLLALIIAIFWWVMYQTPSILWDDYIGWFALLALPFLLVWTIVEPFVWQPQKRDDDS